MRVRVSGAPACNALAAKSSAPAESTPHRRGLTHQVICEVEICSSLKVLPELAYIEISGEWLFIEMLCGEAKSKSSSDEALE